ncbi:MAG: hypothetical protein OXD30_13690 [Bryobacterales bacterium]|nr:hypothetical protein [Bryobacterales bacterium]
MDSTPVNRIPPPAARHSRAKLAAIMAALACAAIPAQAAQGEAAPVFGQIESMLEELRDIMGFGPRRPVAHKTISKAAFRKLYAKRMRQSQKPAEIERQLLFLRLFGLVPDDFDYQKTVLDLLSEQAWALYDFKRRELYLADWAPAEALEYALVHELVHAVDDHHFNLLRYATGASGSEGELARLAAMEGQASWVMTEWAMRRSEKTLEGNRLLAIATASATRFEAQQFPVYGRTPLYFREVLIFPYTDGLLFQDALVRQLGRDGFKRVFERPPETTQHILQPELYLRGFMPEAPPLAGIPLAKGFRRVYQGTFGQLDHRILLEHHLGDEDRGALLDRWRGARFEIYRKHRSDEPLLRYAVRWQDTDAAREYYHLYRQVCERKRTGLALVNRGPNRCEGTTDAGRVVLEIDGNVVRSVEGLPL